MQFLPTTFDQPTPVVRRAVELYTGQNSINDSFNYFFEVVKILQNRQELEKKLFDFMAKKSLSNLTEFFVHFAAVQNRATETIKGYLIRYGRLCSINQPDGSSSRYNWITYGINRFYFQFNHSHYDSPSEDKFTDAIVSFNPAADYAAFN